MDKPKFKIGDLVHITFDDKFVFYKNMLQPGDIGAVTGFVKRPDGRWVYQLNDAQYCYVEHVLELVKPEDIIPGPDTDNDIEDRGSQDTTNDTDILFQVLAALADIRNTLSRLLSKCGYE